MKYFLFLVLFSCSRSEVKILDSDNFQEVALNKAKYVFVYFYSSTCLDCEDYSHLMDQLAEIHKSRRNLIFAKADVGREIPKKMAEFVPKIAPNFKLFKSGDNEVIHYKKKNKNVKNISKFLEKHCRVSVGLSNSVRNTEERFRKMEL